jgi:hypothetical protein
VGRVVSYPRYEVEVVPRSAIRKGDTLLHIAKGNVYELAVKRNPVSLGSFAKSVEVHWPDENVERTFSLGERGVTHLRLARTPA